jgi:PAS domain S-box-containing protein
MLHAEDGEILELSESWLAFSGYTRDDLATTKDWIRLAFPRAAGGVDDPVLDPFLAETDITKLERPVVGGDGRERIWDFSIVPLEPLADGRQLRLTAAVDVTERYMAAEQQALLLRELDHRVKNTLATVQSIASQTFRSTVDPAEFVEKLSERLGSLARTHDMLTKGNWRGVALSGLVEAELAHVPVPERITIAGEDATLPAEMGVPIGLILHELTTNAIKYGALSAPEGRLSIRWSPPPAIGTEGPIHFVWEESGGPPVVEPTTRGFGTRLITQLSRSVGAAEAVFDPAGLRFTLRIDIPARTAMEERMAGVL